MYYKVESIKGDRVFSAADHYTAKSLALDIYDELQPIFGVTLYFARVDKGDETEWVELGTIDERDDIPLEILRGRRCWEPA